MLIYSEFIVIMKAKSDSAFEQPNGTKLNVLRLDATLGFKDV